MFHVARCDSEIVLQSGRRKQAIDHRRLHAFRLGARRKDRPSFADSLGHREYIRGIERFEQLGLQPLLQLVPPLARGQKLDATANLGEGQNAHVQGSRRYGR